MDRIPLRRRTAPLFASLSLPMLLGIAMALGPARGAAVDCPSSADASAGCTNSGLPRFQQKEDATDAAPSARGGLSAYDPAANQPPPGPGSPAVALDAMPSIFLRTLRWLATAMITVGLGMIAARKWIQDRIRKSDEAATLAARRLLEQSEQSRTLPAPAASRRIEWTAERIGALGDASYARLCASYWETKGYESRLVRMPESPDWRIELHRPPDRRVLLGLVQFLPADDGHSGLEAVRHLAEACYRSGIGTAVIMTRRPLSERAQAQAAQQNLQTLDEAGLLGQLRQLTRDQQEALFAELDAFTRSSSDVLESPVS